jgi:glutamate racemase
MQESFRKTIKYFDEIAVTTANMVEFAEIMEYPIAATEQYSKALGKTVDEIEEARKYVISDKTQFSMLTPEVNQFLDQHKPTYDS